MTYNADNNFSNQNPHSAPGADFLGRKLRRSHTDKLLFGVLGGIAETYGWNATILRILFVASMLLPGPQILVYIVAAVLMWNT